MVSQTTAKRSDKKIVGNWDSNRETSPVPVYKNLYGDINRVEKVPRQRKARLSAQELFDNLKDFFVEQEKSRKSGSRSQSPINSKSPIRDFLDKKKSDLSASPRGPVKSPTNPVRGKAYGDFDSPTKNFFSSPAKPGLPSKPIKKSYSKQQLELRKSDNRSKRFGYDPSDENLAIIEDTDLSESVIRSANKIRGPNAMQNQDDVLLTLN